MTMAHESWILLLIVATAIKADPSCVTRGTNVTCSAGDTDYILRRGLVSENPRTTSITLRNCRITDVEQESFHQLPSLQYLDLTENKISRLELGVLDGFKKTKKMYLSYNRLAEIPLGLFDQKPNLEWLDLKGNRINKLELGVFDPLHKLRHLDLSSNDILGRKLSPYIFDESPRIQFMDFSRNNMDGSPDIMLAAFEALDFLNLDRCSLREVPRFATRSNLRTMKHLMLSTNQITKLDNPRIFAHLVNLEKLNLVANFIEEIHEDVFKPLTSLKMIYLSYNKIETIPDKLFERMPLLSDIDLSNNLIKFVPVSAFKGIKREFLRLNLSYNRFTYLQENFCQELRNSNAILSQLFFENNPWQCACLNDILVEAKTQGVAYNADKYNGKYRVCVTKEFVCKRQPISNEYYSSLYYNVV